MARQRAATAASAVCRAARLGVWMLLIVGVGLGLMLVLVTDVLPRANLPIVYLVIPLSTVFWVLAVRLVRWGPDRPGTAALVIGWVVLVGVVAMDVGATLVKTPKLVFEGNPMIRLLIDHGPGLSWGRTFLITIGAMSAGIHCTLWLALLRHRKVWLASSLRGGKSFGAVVVKAATGLPPARFRRLAGHLTRTEVRRALYHMIWVLALVRFGAQLHRGFVGLRWLRLVPAVPPPVLVPTFAVLTLSVAVWILRRQYLRHRAGAG